MMSKHLIYNKYFAVVAANDVNHYITCVDVVDSQNYSFTPL